MKTLFYLGAIVIITLISICVNLMGYRLGSLSYAILGAGFVALAEYLYQKWKNKHDK